MKLYIFGYGSLISHRGINGRGMKRKYKKEDLLECTLSSYKREFNAVNRHSDKYFGITEDKNSQVCGVLFEVSPEDMIPFVKSEGGDELYFFRDVTDNIEFNFSGSIDYSTSKVITCVTKYPSKQGIVPKHYINWCKSYLKERSQEFRDSFGLIRKYL
jgi:hypothetical protein